METQYYAQLVGDEDLKKAASLLGERANQPHNMALHEKEYSHRNKAYTKIIRFHRENNLPINREKIQRMCGIIR